MENVEKIRSILESIVQFIVDEDGAVRVEAIQDDNVVRFKLTVAPADAGIMVSSQNRLADSLRNILAAMGHAAKIRARLEIED